MQETTFRKQETNGTRPGRKPRRGVASRFFRSLANGLKVTGIVCALALSSCAAEYPGIMKSDARKPDVATVDSNKKDSNIKDSKIPDKRIVDGERLDQTADIKQDTQPQWWDTNWKYCREIKITGNVPAGFSHGVLLVDHTHTNADLSDVRSLEGTCKSPNTVIGILPSWAEKIDSIKGSKVWFKTQTASIANVAIYYGNSSAKSVFSGSAVFYGADVGFDSSTGWSELDPNSKISINTSNSRLEFSGLQRNVVAYTYAKMAKGMNPLVFEFAYKYSSGSNGTPQIYMADGIANNLYAQKNAIGLRFDNPAGNGVYFISRVNGTTYNSTVHTLTATTIGKTWYLRIKLISGSNAKLEAWLDNPQKIGTPDYTASLANAPAVPLTHVFAVSGNLDSLSNSSDGWVDSVIVRKYTSPEPTYTVGTEQKP